MKPIKVNYIDTAGHGYYSVSKKDFLLVCGVHEITGSSGHTFTRMYLEEDQDASTFFNKAKSLGIEVKIKSGYNPKFQITHGYKPELFSYIPEIGDIIDCHGREYFVVDIHEDKATMIRDIQTGMIYRISGHNPFAFITKLNSKLDARLAHKPTDKNHANKMVA